MGDSSFVTLTAGQHPYLDDEPAYEVTFDDVNGNGFLDTAPNGTPENIIEGSVIFHGVDDRLNSLNEPIVIEGTDLNYISPILRDIFSDQENIENATPLEINFE